MRALIWFRADLRTRDHPALAEACRRAERGVVGLFVICPETWRKHDWAPIKVDLVLRTLADLSVSLAELRIPLLVREVPRFADVPGLVESVCVEHEIDRVTWGAQYEVDEAERDAAVRRRLEERGVEVRELTTQSILPPATVRTGQGGFYTVFTPYRKRWLAAVEEAGGAPCERRPGAQAETGIAADPVPAQVAGFEGLRRPDLWKSGEDHALDRLRAFVDGRIGDYADRRDLPGVNGTSTLSPQLAIGTLSPRQCLGAAVRANDGRLAGGRKGIETWITELAWREFYRHVLVGYPRVSKNRPFRLETDAVAWRDAPEELARWQEGRTGYPIVDAGMRQLAQTGWMHNRLRMITAMFLTKNLLIDWRRGETFFMRHLVDGDLAQNSGGWQWSASVGTDAAPYFRIFHPVRQSERFDPDGVFLRRFLPELESLDERAIHSPWERSPGAARGAGYPEPIVDIPTSRQRAIAAFKALGS